MKKITAILLSLFLLLISTGCATTQDKKTGVEEAVFKSDAITPIEISSALVGMAGGFVWDHGSDYGVKTIVTIGMGLFVYGIGSILLSNSYKTEYRDDFINYGALFGSLVGLSYAIYEGVRLSEMNSSGGFMGLFIGCITTPFGTFIGAGLGNIAGHIADIFTGTTGNEGRRK